MSEKKTIGFIVDTAADIPTELLKEYDIGLLPLYAELGDKKYFPWVDVTNDEYYDIMTASKEFPKTAMMSPAEIEDMYREKLAKYDCVVHTTIANTASGAFSSASIVANEMIEKEGADITVIDSWSLCVAIGIPVVNAAKMHREGAGKEEVIEYIQKFTKAGNVYFAVDDLQHLKKGGRIKASAVVIAELLDIKPVLCINEGLVHVIEKVRGGKRAIARVVELALERGDNIKEQDIGIIHTRGGEKLELLKKLVEEKIAPKSITVYDLGPTIASHVGLGVVGMYFAEKV